MSYLYETRIITGVKRTACAILLTLAFGSTAAWAQTESVRYQEMQALAEAGPYWDESLCIPANGAQILGGFAGPEDRLHAVTGHVCPR